MRFELIVDKSKCTTKPFQYLNFFITIFTELFVIVRAGNRHSFFADPDPAFFLNADPDPAAFLMRIRIQL